MVKKNSYILICSAFTAQEYLYSLKYKTLFLTKYDKKT